MSPYIRQTLALVIFASSLIFGTAFAESDKPSIAEAHQAPASLDWPGVYRGFVPCDDCKGIKTELALNKNNTYLLLSVYVGKSEREYVDKGTFTFEVQNNSVVLTSRKDGKVRRYEVGENKLTQLDDQGYAYNGKIAARYILQKTEVAVPKRGSHH